MEDIRETVRVQWDFDIVVYASIGGAPGSFKECVGRLRDTVNAGGYLVIDDGFLKTGQKKPSRKGYEHYASHQSTISQLESHGDRVISEVGADDETNRFNAESMRAITARAQGLSDRYPELKDMIENYLKDERLECELLNNSISSAIWLIEKRDKASAA
ncbi:hypothetical protein ACFL4K_03265 [Candidatus Neomarinimicrobiota bacterium]